MRFNFARTLDIAIALALSAVTLLGPVNASARTHSRAGQVNNTGENIVLNMKPEISADCSKYNYPEVNWLFWPRMVAKTGDIVEFDMLTGLEACYNSETTEIKIHEHDLYTVYAVAERGVWPWEKEPVTAKYFRHSTGTVEVHLFVSLKGTLQNKKIGRFRMVFAPRGLYNPSYLWYGTVQKDARAPGGYKLRIATRQKS